jgi:hypothetical protein
VEEALCVQVTFGQTKLGFREYGQDTHLRHIRVGGRNGAGTAYKYVGRLRVPCSKRGYTVCQQRRQGAIEHATGDIVELKEGEVSGEALKEHLDEVHEHRWVRHCAMTRIK